MRSAALTRRSGIGPPIDGCRGNGSMGIGAWGNGTWLCAPRDIAPQLSAVRDTAAPRNSLRDWVMPALLLDRSAPPAAQGAVERSGGIIGGLHYTETGPGCTCSPAE